MESRILTVPGDEGEHYFWLEAAEEFLVLLFAQRRCLVCGVAIKKKNKELSGLEQEKFVLPGFWKPDVCNQSW